MGVLRDIVDAYRKGRERGRRDAALAPEHKELTEILSNGVDYATKCRLEQRLEEVEAGRGMEDSYKSASIGRKLAYSFGFLFYSADQRLDRI